MQSQSKNKRIRHFEEWDRIHCLHFLNQEIISIIIDTPGMRQLPTLLIVK